MAKKKERNDVGIFMRIQFTNGERFGPGKARLLEAIDATGSISEAARTMAMSYRRAWLLVDSTNKLFGRPVVTAAQGGKQGGGASLTPFGRELLDRWRELRSTVERAAADDLLRFAFWARQATS